MPYINDVLAANQSRNEEEKARLAGKGRSRFLFDPDAVVALLRARIVGQPEMLQAMADMLHVVKADFGSRQRPLAVFCFIGSTGVGKTETVRVLAEAIAGSADAVCRIDMNTLAQEHYSSALTGAPPGYVGSKENHTLWDVDKIAGSYSKPGIVLFDEVEKASDEVLRALLNVLDSGRLELSAGTKHLDFNNSLIFMTSNVGARALVDYRQRCEQGGQGWRRWLSGEASRGEQESAILDEALHQRFDPEFINRIDRIIAFKALATDWMEPLLAIEMDKLNQRLRQYGVSVILDEAARAFLLADPDPRFGARHVIRRLRAELEPMLARALNGGMGEGAYEVCCQEGGLQLLAQKAI